MKWWTFKLPNAWAHVPAKTEEHARGILRRTCYQGAPVEKWPCVDTRGGTRDDIAAALLWATGWKK